MIPTTEDEEDDEDEEEEEDEEDEEDIRGDDKSYFVMKSNAVEIAKEVMTGDVSPAMMFYILAPRGVDSSCLVFCECTRRIYII